MKRLLTLLAVLFVFSMSAHAASPIKQYYAYTIKNVTLNETAQIMDDAIEGERGVRKLTGTPNAYYITWQGPNDEEHYYIKLYPANKNTDIYVVSDASYSKENNDLTKTLKAKGLTYRILDDNVALKEYKFDFIDYARQGNLDGLFIMPDYIKPLKTGMGKLNDKISKNSKKNAAIAYSEDKDPIDLTCVNTETYDNPEAQVSITVKEYRLKNKQNKYVHAYEYVVKNYGDSNITIDKVTSERVASMKDITTQTFVDLDRLDLADTIGSFPPVAICTCGTSLAFTVANNVRLAKVAAESVRFAHSFPENYNIKAGQSMRILTMKFKNDPKPLNFFTTRDGINYNFSF